MTPAKFDQAITSNLKMIEIIKAGQFTTIQDIGRSGYEHLGVPPSGACDKPSQRLANLLVGNSINSATLECTLVGPVIRFHTDTNIAITGATCKATLNGSSITQGQRIRVHEGDLLDIGPLYNGCKTYIGIGGGILSKKVLESQSYCKDVLDEGVLVAGQRIRLGSYAHQESISNAKISLQKERQDTIYVSKGPEYDLIFHKAIDTLKAEVMNHNRMGYRLSSSLSHQYASLPSNIVYPGIVQCTPAGQLIVVMPDGQTTGGYPRVFIIGEEGLAHMAQRRVGDKVTFVIK